MLLRPEVKLSSSNGLIGTFQVRTVVAILSPSADSYVVREAFNETLIGSGRGGYEVGRKYCVSARQLAALARRHVFAVCLVLLVTAGLAVGFRYAQSGYEETAIVALEPGSFFSVKPLSADQDFSLNRTLITTCQLFAIHLSGPQGAIQLRQAGVTGSFAISVVNDENVDTPAYPYPDLSMSVAGASPVTTHRQFIEAIRVITLDIDDLQASNKISRQDRFSVYTLSDSGPVSQRGSLIRTYAALIFLALVAMFLICGFLDRRSRASRPFGLTRSGVLRAS
jgi:hypothetical protein